jgi:hypothetical protein
MSLCVIVWISRVSIIACHDDWLVRGENLLAKAAVLLETETDFPALTLASAIKPPKMSPKEQHTAHLEL